jgi:hypothetical protein
VVGSDAAPEPSGPLPPAPPTAWNQPPGWPPAHAPVATLDVGRVVGRTFDTLGREWSLFLVLAVPAGLGGIASAAFTQSFQALLRDPDAAAAVDQAPLFLAQLIIALLSGVTTLATIVATDHLWRGTSIGLADALGAGVQLVPRALGLLLLGLLIAIGLSFVAVISLLVIAALGPIGVFLGVVGFFGFLVLAFWVSARLSLLLPVLALEGTPVVAVIGRTWRLTKGRALLLFLTALVISLCSLLPAWGGTLFSMFVDDRLVAGIAVGLATLVTAPLAGIWTVLAWGELTNAPHADSPVMATGKGRIVAALLILGVGMVLLLVGGAMAATGSSEFLRLSEGV